MATIRTARVLAALASLPLAVALFAGTAAADSGNGSANVAKTEQAAFGMGNTNQSNTASVNGSGFTVIEQTNVDVDVTNLW